MIVQDILYINFLLLNMQKQAYYVGGRTLKIVGQV